jgi:hypothetical protein
MSVSGAEDFADATPAALMEFARGVALAIKAKVGVVQCFCSNDSTVSTRSFIVSGVGARFTPRMEKQQHRLSFSNFKVKRLSYKSSSDNTTAATIARSRGSVCIGVHSFFIALDGGVDTLCKQTAKLGYATTDSGG